jgi:hypothetical protein
MPWTYRLDALTGAITDEEWAGRPLKQGFSSEGSAAQCPPQWTFRPPCRARLLLRLGYIPWKYWYRGHTLR